MIDSFEMRTDAELTMLVRTSNRRALFRKMFHGGLVALALGGTLALVSDDRALFGTMFMIGSMCVVALGFVVLALGVRDRRTRVFERQIAIDATSIDVDGDKQPRASVRGIIRGHFLTSGRRTRYGPVVTQHWFPVFVAIGDQLIEIDTFPEDYAARDIARSLADALGVSIVQEERGGSAGFAVPFVMAVVITGYVFAFSYGFTGFTDFGREPARVALAAPLTAVAIYGTIALARAACRGLLGDGPPLPGFPTADAPKKRKKKKKAEDHEIDVPG